MAKSADAFRTISEVADWLDTPAHVLRFWESKFPQVKPVKRAGGRRYYRPADMLLLGGIKRLLHEDGMTIKGVQKLLREKGVAHVADLAPPLDGEIGEDTPALPAAEVVAFPSPRVHGESQPPRLEASTEVEATVEAPAPDDAPLAPLAEAPAQDPREEAALGDVTAPAPADEPPVDLAAPEAPPTDAPVLAAEDDETEGAADGETDGGDQDFDTLPMAEAEETVPDTPHPATGRDLFAGARDDIDASTGWSAPQDLPEDDDEAPFMEAEEEDPVQDSIVAAQGPRARSLVTAPDPGDSDGPALPGLLARISARRHGFTPAELSHIRPLAARLAEFSDRPAG